MGDAHKDHPFILGEAAQSGLQDLVFALAFLEADQLQARALDEGFDRANERLGHLNSLFGGGEPVSQISPAKGRDAGLAGELGPVGVQVHPVDALQLQDDVFPLEFGQAVGYFHGEFRLGFCSPVYGATAACRQYSGAERHRAAQPDSSFKAQTGPTDGRSPDP